MKILSVPMHSSYMCFMRLKDIICLNLASIGSFNEFLGYPFEFPN